VLLLHNNGYDHKAFAPLSPLLFRSGARVLALDLRGHGASRKLAPEKYDHLVRREADVYREMVFDAEAGVRFLTHVKGVPPERIAVLGGELGCGIGFALLARNQRLAGLIALSPGLQDYGFQSLELVKQYGRRPLLIIAGKRQLGNGPQAIADALQSTAKVQLEVWPGADVRGVQMLGQPAKVERVILDWLQALFVPAR
jgi:pimeloyl-ACP methyl ester carboxylesterase